jgi:hypothetical protein
MKEFIDFMPDGSGGEQKEESEDRIAQWFLPTRTPFGAAPEEIREKWIGVPLPVRESNLTENLNTLQGYLPGMNIDDPTDVIINEPSETVVVESLDAFKALRAAGQTEAAQWWEQWFWSRHQFMGNSLIFQAEEGQLLSPEEAEEQLPGLPGIRNFDDLEV